MGKTKECSLAPQARYDYLVVGAGLFGATFAERMTSAGHSCLVIDRRSHIAGNAHCDNVDGILVHRYGPHIFHTSDDTVWEYVNRFAQFNRFVNSPIAFVGDEIYNLPFNMNTFSRMWGVRTPQEAEEMIRQQVEAEGIGTPRNLEEQALKMVGRDIYEKLVKGYTEKQWGRPCNELPASIIRRLPLRFTYDNNYFDDRWQGIPEDGYDAMVAMMLENSDVLLSTDYSGFIDQHPGIAPMTVFTGPIDEFFDYCYGPLEYRTVRFEDEIIECPNWQGNAAVNYTGADVPYTRSIEHKHFAFGKQPFTVVTREYSEEWTKGAEPYYPVNDERNQRLYEEYRKKAEELDGVIFGGRLGEYRYWNMDQAIRAALDLAELELQEG